ncbi:MAG: nucleotide sugar dehydrogenase [Chloroflexi bacterium]|nr:nucleotide sugar dehydrogenase [Chloroflexota bacterium]MDA8187645.1 nucleotide sugar dehydrogenase [Dehalococcoidales bacterium]
MELERSSQILRDRISNRSAKVCVIGLGYVGLPLAVEFARAHLEVHGIDLDNARVNAIQRGESYIPDVDRQVVADLVKAGSLKATSDYDTLVDADVIFICVPTPFTANKSPDISFIVAAAGGIAQRLSPGKLVILQSTTHPGTTEEDVLPVLEKSGLKGGRDFHLAFSPERINPGDRVHTVANTPKVIGGLTPVCSEMASLLFRHISSEILVVSSPRAAEMSKLLENIFRSVNIALVNELAKLAERMSIDIWEVIQAASTKPFGFMPFYPGPGCGGHCIPVDPYYLSWKAREYDFYTKFIELAAEVNQSMPYHVLEKVGEALNGSKKCLKGAKVLVLGVAFKKDIDDARNSPAERIIELLLESGALISYNDPFVPVFAIGRDAFHRQHTELQSLPLDAAVIAENDCVVIVAAHSSYDYQWIVDTAQLVVDTCNATKSIHGAANKVVRLGSPRQT